MALLQFPRNDEVLDRGVGGDARRGFSKPWLQFLQSIYQRMKAVEAVEAITTADLGTAGASYSQADAQAQNDLINELKAQIVALQTALNK